MQSIFVVVDKHRGGDVHGIHQRKSILDAGFTQTFLDGRSYVQKGPAPFHFKPQFLAVTLHDSIVRRAGLTAHV